jgi:cytochrome d ubiquinol oxidase subunit I
MVGSGFLMFFIIAIILFFIFRNRSLHEVKLFKFLPLAIILPYIANSSGWILTEIGRQPWVVYGYLKTENAISPNLTVGMVLTSLIGFILIYGGLMVADIYLLQKYAKDPLTETPGFETEINYWESEI